MEYVEFATKFHQFMRNLYKSKPRNKNSNLIDIDSMRIKKYPSSEGIYWREMSVMSGLSEKEILEKFYKCVCNTEPITVIEKVKDFPFNLRMNPGLVPVLDHVIAQLESSKVEGGGTYRKLIEDSINELDANRQVTSRANPKVHEIRLHESEVKDLKEFLASFNKEMKYLSSLHKETTEMPCSLYSFSTRYIQLSGSGTARVTSSFTKKKEEVKIKVYSDTFVPARISLTVIGKRWDIIIPWEKKSDEDYILRIKGYTHDLWIKIFERLHGVAVGDDMKRQIGSINAFLKDNYKFTNISDDIKLKHVDICVLLYIAGVNGLPAELSAWLYFFTGGFHLSNIDLKEGQEYSNSSFIYSIYIQSVGQAVYVIAKLCQISFLLHLFPTPGLAIMISGKDLDNFLMWFDCFYSGILKDAFIVDKYIPVDDPRCMMNKISYGGIKPIIDVSTLLEMLPDWEGVTDGGCLSDKVVIKHLLLKVVPVMINVKMGYKLRWTVDKDDLDIIFKPFIEDEGGIIDELFNKSHMSYDPAGYVVPEILELEQVTDNEEIVEVLYKSRGLIKSALMDFMTVNEWSFSQAYLLLLWRHTAPAAVLFRMIQEKLESRIFLCARSFLKATTDMEIEDSDVVVEWKKMRVEMCMAKRIVTSKAAERNEGLEIAVKRKAERNLKRASKFFDVEEKNAYSFAVKRMNTLTQTKVVKVDDSEKVDVDEFVLTLEEDELRFSDTE